VEYQTVNLARLLKIQGVGFMEYNRFIIKVTAPGSVSVLVGEKLKDLGVKRLNYIPHRWEVETEYSKEELLENLRRVTVDKAQIEIEEL